MNRSWPISIENGKMSSFHRTSRFPARTARNAPFGAPGGLPRNPFRNFRERTGNPSPETYTYTCFLQFPEISTNSKKPERSSGEPIWSPQTRKSPKTYIYIYTFLERDFGVRRRQEPFWAPKGSPKEISGSVSRGTKSLHILQVL